MILLTERALIETYEVKKNTILIQSLMLLSVRKSLARSRPAGNFTNQILRHSINCGLLIFICVLLATDCKNENLWSSLKDSKLYQIGSQFIILKVCNSKYANENLQDANERVHRIKKVKSPAVIDLAIDFLTESSVNDWIKIAFFLTSYVSINALSVRTRLKRLWGLSSRKRLQD